MQEYFYDLVDHVFGKLQGSEVLLVNFSGERSDFIRFNNSKVRQCGTVSQGYVTLDLIEGSRHASSTVTISNDSQSDRGCLEKALVALRERLPLTPEDPYLLYSTDVQSTERCGEDNLPPADRVLQAILKAGDGRDMVGIYAGGGIFAGFGNSLGQRNWFSTHSFHFSWSFYHSADKAVKSNYADFEWSDETFEQKISSATEQLKILTRRPRTIPPGKFRVYLAPAALEEFVDLLCWGGFSLKSHRTKNTPLLRMITDGATLSEGVTIAENTGEGIAPNFQPQGFIRPDKVMLIDGGRYRDTLISPRSGKEYDVQPNGAGGSESPESLDMQPGNIPTDEVLGRLDTGVYVNQTWYLNFSDRPAARITGMTRFATFWVENGEISAPLNVMRFDETAYRALGENLIGLTRERDFFPSGATYSSRSTDSTRLPGALIDDFAFTL